MADATRSEATELSRLMMWLSPALPVGGFAWSGGLEAAVARGLVTDNATLHDYLKAALERGGIALDCGAVGAVLSRNATAQDASDHLLTLATTAEREAELRELGWAFDQATNAWGDGQTYATDLAYPAAFAKRARALNLPHPTILHAFATHLVSAQIQAALRLLPLGQRAGVSLLASLEPAIAACAERALGCRLEGLATSTFAMDIAAMQHRALPFRIFRS